MSNDTSQNARIGKYGKTAVQLGCLAGALLTLPGCQSITGSAQLSQVRMINASPDAGGGALDFYLGSSALAKNVGFGYSTSYVPISPGNYSVSANGAGNTQKLITENGTFLNSAEYTAIVGAYAANLVEVIVKDQSVSAPAGQISVRVIDASYKAGAVDIYLVPTGSTAAGAAKIFSTVTPSSVPAYLDEPANTYTVVVMPAGVAPGTSGTSALYTGPALSYPGGCARTILLLDSQVTTSPSISAQVLADFDLPGEGN